MNQGFRTWGIRAAALGGMAALLVPAAEIAGALNGLLVVVAWISATVILRKREALPRSLKVIHLGVGLICLGAVVRIVEAAVAGAVVIPGFADLAFGPGYVIVAYGAMSAATARRALARVSDFIDAAVVSLTIIAVVFVVAAPYLIGTAPMAERGVTAGFVIADSVLLAVSAVMVLGPGTQTKGAVYLGLAGFLGSFFDLGTVIGLAHSPLLTDSLMRYSGLFGIAYLAACRSTDYVDFPKPGARSQRQRWWLYGPALFLALFVAQGSMWPLALMIVGLSTTRFGVSAVHAERIRRLLEMQSDLAVRLTDSDNTDDAMASLTHVASKLTGREASARLGKGAHPMAQGVVVISDPDETVALSIPGDVPDSLWVTCENLVRVTALAVRNVDARTARVEARMARNWKILAGGSSEAGFLVDPDGCITTATPNVTDLIGGDPIGKYLSEVLSVDVTDLLAKKVDSTQFQEDDRWFEVTAQPAQNSMTVVNVQDVTNTILAERTDPITGLANVRDLITREPIEQATVVVFNLDSLPRILGTYGRETTDLLLRELASRLSDSFRDNIDQVWRGDGDTFVVVAAGSSHRKEWVESRRAKLAAPVVIEGEPVLLTITATAASIGDSTPVDEALRLSDLARRDGRIVEGSTAMFTEELRAESDRRFVIESVLMSSDDLAAAGFTVNYQPLVNSSTGQVAAVEALCRWMHPELGPIFPDEFIGIAERINQVARLDAFVLDTVIADRPRIRQLGEHVTTQINLSPMGVTPSALRGIAGSVSERLGSEPRLTIEFTESPVDDQTFINLAEALNDVRAAGIGVSLDDFGTGASNFVRLSTMPLTQVKLAGEFTDRALPEVTSNVIEAIHQLGCECVVENVETVEQAGVMSNMGADLLQGWFVSKALPIDELLVADLSVWSTAVGTAGVAS